MARQMWWFLGVAVTVGLAGRAVPVRGDEPVADDATVVALVLALSCGGTRQVPPGDAARGGGTEVELVARVRAKSVRFDQVPAASDLLGSGGMRQRSCRMHRVNLPARPEPGVVYRDVEVKLTLWGDVQELIALLADARHAARGIRFSPDPDDLGPARDPARDAAAERTAAPAEPEPGPPDAGR